MLIVPKGLYARVLRRYNTAPYKARGAYLAVPEESKQESRTMTIKAGDKMPEGTLTVMTDDGPNGVSTDELFGGKKVVLFSVPGAFFLRYGFPHRAAW